MRRPQRSHGSGTTRALVALSLGAILATFLLIPPSASAERPARECRGSKCTFSATTSTTTSVVSDPEPSPAPVDATFEDGFDRSDGLVTNEYATWNSTDPLAVRSNDWRMTSGSLFARGGSGWTGEIDDHAPDPTSSTATNSAVFRLLTERRDFEDIAVEFRLRTLALTSTPSTPAVAWDGVHIFLRYQSEESLYYASVNRRDGSVVIKKKVPGGPSNGGTYYTLATGKRAIPFDRWQDVRATIVTTTDGAVKITLAVDGRVVVAATDSGVGGPPIASGGRSGIRGDNAQFEFDDFRVTDR